LLMEKVFPRQGSVVSAKDMVAALAALSEVSGKATSLPRDAGGC
jgi:hypothetical protein